MAHLSRRSLIGSTLAAGVAGCEGPAGRGSRRTDPTAPRSPSELEVHGASEPPRRPNILYIYADQFRWNAMGVAGMPLVQTPNLDALAAGAVRFADCHTSSPLCMPARSVMMSGVLPSRSGVVTNASWPDLDGPSHVRRLRDEAGYRTSVIGKVHLHHGTGHKDDWFDRLDRVGFSDGIELSGVRLCARYPNAWSDWLSARTEPGRVDRYQLFRRFVREYEDVSHVNGEWLAPRFDDPRWGLSASEHVGSWMADTAADWIAAAAGDSPWYLQVNFPGPHPPWDAPAPWAEMYDPRDPDLPLPDARDPGRPWSGLVRILRRKWSMPLGDDDRRAMVTKYLARVSMVDALVGRVIEGLAESGQLDNTWVVFGADHGELLGDKNLIGKIAFFDGSVRVPLIMRPPGGSVGWTASGWCDQLDVTATLLALGGLDPRIHLGVPLHDAVLGGPGQFTGKSTVVSEVADYSMVLDDRYKAVVDRRTQTVAELYDRVEDPGEWENRVGDASLEGVRRAAIDQLAHLTGADS